MASEFVRKHVPARCGLSGKIASVVAASLALVGCSTLPSELTPIASTENGQVRGVDGDVVVYRGIPFAAPPTGERRWRSPGPTAQWSGVRDATTFGAACPQPSLPAPFGVEGPQSEDCLTLNVWVPNHVSGGAKLPVMLWFHGGAYLFGAGSQAAYDGTALAKRGVIVVTANYRLGALGFLAHPTLSAEKSGKPLGNYGLEDQLAALQWVRRNISSFGGDADNVTVFGESAGAVSVQALMAMPAATGQFAKAISQSGGGTAVFLRAGAGSQGDALGEQWAALAGAPGATAAALRQLPVEKVLAAPFLSFPHVDGVLLTASPGEVFDRGLQAKVPLLIGSNSFEANLPAFNDDLARATLGKRYDEIARAYRAAFGNGPKASQQLRGDLFFVAPSRFLAKRHASTGAPVYLYHFDWLAASARSSMPGAPHAGELGFLFAQPEAWATTWDEQDRMISEQLIGYWTEFAKTGDPNHGALRSWSVASAATAYELRIRQYVEMTVPTDLARQMEESAVAAAAEAWAIQRPSAQ